LRRSLPPPDGVVVHPGSSVGEPMHEALRRVADMVKHALAESDKCRLLLENAAGTGNTIGRTFVELREVIDLAGGDRRIGVCLDSCHMFATGFDIGRRTSSAR
jgi:deoxyribonuclease IV